MTALTSTLIAPSRDTRKPWVYLIGYTFHSGARANSTIVPRADPISDLEQLNQVRQECAGMEGIPVDTISIVGVTLVSSPEVMTIRVPDSGFGGYRYLTVLWGRNSRGQVNFFNFVPDLDVPLYDEHVIRRVERSIASQIPQVSGVCLLSFQLIAGPAT